MLFRRARKQAAALSSLMSQTQDVIVCFDFDEPIDVHGDPARVSEQLKKAHVIEASEPFANFFGYKNREDIIGADMMSVVKGNIPEWFMNYGTEVEQNQFNTLERIVQVPIGDTILHVRIHMENIFENDLLIRQWVNMRDVTKEEEMRVALQTKEQMQSLSFDAIGLETFEVQLPMQTTTKMPDWWQSIHERDIKRVKRDFEAFSHNADGKIQSSFRLVDQKSGNVTHKECWVIKRHSNGDTSPQAAIGVLMDRTEEKFLEEKVLAAQRWESLGVLAGGIAHDFNNLLVSVVGSLELAKLRHPDLADIIDPSNQAAGQLAALCQQLLTYAGKGQVEQQAMNLSELVGDFEDVLRLSIHHNASLTLDLDPDAWICGDHNQIRQLILNLVKNASDALAEQSGVIQIKTKIETNGEAKERGLRFGEELHTNHVVILEVSDSGSGVEPDLLDRMFDPFFTTKSTGKGLGLAVVVGVVKSHRGAIRVDSGEGNTKLTIALPHEAPGETLQNIDKPAPQTDTAQRVLIIDDAPDVLAAASAMFNAMNVEVESISNADEGIARYRQDPDRAVFMDVTMPDKNGIDAAVEILAEFPDARIVLCSGYTNLALPDALKHRVQFLQKPFRLSALRELDLSA